MDKESSSSFGAPWMQGVVLALLLGVGAFVIRDQPYSSDRQVDDAPPRDAAASAQTVDARLWQDPLGVVERAVVAASMPPAPPRGFPEGVAVLPVMLRGGPYPENVEHRRRLRYAVVAALSAMGYAPSDADHLQWLAPALPDLPGVIPYEGFDITPDRAQSAERRGETRLARVQVLWLDDRFFLERPVARMAQLAQALQPGQAPWRVVGPVRSDGLDAMVRESGEAGLTTLGARLRFYAATPTVPDASLMSELDPAPLADSECPLAQRLKKTLGVHLARTISNDGQLVRALVDELQLRGLHAVKLPGTEGASNEKSYAEMCRPAGRGLPGAPSHVAVVAEWDTLYGRSLRRSFRAEQGIEGFCVERFNYMRGLDGLLPAPGNADASRKGGKTEAANGPESRRNDGTFIERAEGQGQFDYLRRLSEHMRERDRELRLASADGQGLRAIGVLGNDVHDKLLVMQALQPEFPSAMFFTTDLDARYLHPREQAWARNVLVASSFGLRLADGLQAGTPPFRDGYQTAVFLATRLAMDDARHAHAPARAAPAEAPKISPCPHEAGSAWTQPRLDGWLSQPRIFEIGRTQAFDFVGRPPALLAPAPALPFPAAAAADRSLSQCRGEHWIEGCEDIHPAGSRMAPIGSFWSRSVAAAALLLLLMPVAVTYHGGWAATIAAWRAKGALQADRRRRRIRLALAAIAGLLVLPAVFALSWPPLAGWMTERGKPIVFTEGISPWPTELMRLFTLLLGGYLLLRGWRALKRSEQRIAQHFLLEAPRAAIEAWQESQEKALGWRQRLLNMFRLHEVSPSGVPGSAALGLAPGTEISWQRHVVQNRFSARLVRTAAFVLLMLLLSAAIVLAFGEQRFVPQRGLLALRVHEALHVLVFLMLYVVVFFVADATVLCVSFLRELRHGESMWPAGTIKHFERRMAFSEARLIDHWIDLQFLAARTAAINQLVYYPFVMLSLVLLSRSATFDDWTMPVSGKVLAVLGALIALACAVALRRAAESTRRAALIDVDVALMQANGQADRPGERQVEHAGPTARQLEQLRAHIVGLDRGAFAPYTQQPLLKALLLPFATIGGTSLLEALRLANL